MADETTTEASDEMNISPGVPMINGQPHEGGSNVGQMNDSVGDPGENPAESSEKLAENNERVRESKPVKGRPKRYMAQETDEIVRKELDKAGISYLRTACLTESITIELPGEGDNLLEDIAKLLNKPGVFGFAGATKKSQLIEVKHMKNQFGQVTRTVVKYFRRFAEQMWEGPTPE